jgi:hypothetical protein
MSFDKIFSLSNRLNENRFGPGKAKVVSDGNKVVATPIDRNSFKVKAVGYQDMIVQGRLTAAGFNGILNWLKQQPDIIDYYYKLNDLKAHFLVYQIMKDNDLFEKQSFQFTIVERSTVPTLSPAVNHVSLEELESIQKGIGPKDLVVSPSQQILGKPGVDPVKATGLTFPIVATSIPGNKNTSLVSFVRDAYLKVKQDPNVSSYAGLVAVKAEVNKGELGKSSQAFIYALNSAFGIKDWSGEEVESNLTAALATKLYAAPAATTESAKYFLHPNGRQLIKEDIDALPGFSSNAFIAGFDQAIKGLGGGPTNTGGIAVPAEGFKYDASFKLKNAELQKFQEILLKNLPTYAGGALKTRPAVAAFLRTKADGIYGNRTRDLIGYLKVGLTDPKYPDNDNSTIKADFVNRMLKEFKVVQENKTYLGLDGYSIIIEGFDASAADVATGGGGGGTGGTRQVVNKGTDSSSSTSKSSSDVRSLEGVGFEYIVQDGFWKFRPKGTKDAWKKAVTPANIAKLQKNFPEDGGNYIRPAAPEYQYKLEGGVWKVKTGGKWVDANDESKRDLAGIYGSGQGAPKTSAKSLTIKEIDAAHKDIAKTVKKLMDNNANWTTYIGTFKTGWNDDEAGAWIEFKRIWSGGSTSIAARLKKTKDAINLLPTDGEQQRLLKNQGHLERIKTYAGDGSFYSKFIGDSFDDTFTVQLRQSDGTVWPLAIDTDFG